MKSLRSVAMVLRSFSVNHSIIVLELLEFARSKSYRRREGLWYLVNPLSKREESCTQDAGVLLREGDG